MGVSQAKGSHRGETPSKDTSVRINFKTYTHVHVGSVVENPSANAGVVDLIPGMGRFPGEGNGNPLQYSHLGNPMDREPGGL